MEFAYFPCIGVGFLRVMFFNLDEGRQVEGGPRLTAGLGGQSVRKYWGEPGGLRYDTDAGLGGGMDLEKGGEGFFFK